MNEDTQILKDYVESLPSSLRQYLKGGQWSKDVGLVAQNFGLQEYQVMTIKNEVLFVILGLEPYENLFQNLITKAGLIESMAEKIVLQISEQILDKIEVPERINNPLNSEPKKERQNNVGSDFEQTILNQAKAMRPAVPANLPTESAPQQNLHDYSSGQDPY